MPRRKFGKPPTPATKGSTAAVVGVAQAVATGVTAAGEAAVQVVNPEASYPAPTVTAPKAPKAPKPYRPWKTGEAVGPWEAGKEGPWESGEAVGPWESGAKGKWKKGATGAWEGGAEGKWADRGKSRVGPTGPSIADGFRDRNLVGSRNVIENFDGSVVDSAGGAGGGGGTGSPLAAATSAVRGLGLKTAQIKGESVEELVGRGAKRTRRTGAKRSE